MCLCSKQSSLFSFYALPSGGKLKDPVVHFEISFYEVLFLTLGIEPEWRQYLMVYELEC